MACGRLYVYGLAAAGAPGMLRLFEILEDEIRICLSLLGVTGYHELDKSYLRPARQVVAASRAQRLPASEPAARDILAGRQPRPELQNRKVSPVSISTGRPATVNGLNCHSVSAAAMFCFCSADPRMT